MNCILVKVNKLTNLYGVLVVRSIVVVDKIEIGNIVVVIVVVVIVVTLIAVDVAN